jgi:hypothetical protein
VSVYCSFGQPELFENNHPKYFIFAHRLLANIAGATSARLREQMIWNRTVNAVGGARNNIPKDLHCEHLNRQYKENSRDAGGQLTEATINRPPYQSFHIFFLQIPKFVHDRFLLFTSS